MPPKVRLIVERDVPVPMRDGTALSADLYRPDTGGPCPVLLQRTPYDKSVASTTEAIRFASAGYAVVIQDTRGRFMSEGEFSPFASEMWDGYDSIEWCAVQPWSAGRVGMFGASYTGATQWLAAHAHPPHLAAIAPALTASNATDGWLYQGGAFSLGFALSWTLGLATETLRRTQATFPDAAARTAGLIDAIDHLPDVLRRLPLDAQPELVDLAPYYLDWLGEPVDANSPPRDAIGDVAISVDVPTFQIAGWYDMFLSGALRDFASPLIEPAPSVARPERSLLIGPWSHGLPWMANPVGEVGFGAMSEAVALDLTGLQLRWFDRWLKGRHDPGPRRGPVRMFVMGENVWRDESTWPLSRARPTAYYLHSGGRANSLRGDGFLSMAPPGNGPPDRFIYDPADPIPTRGGCLCCSQEFLPGGAFDQRDVEHRADVLVYTSAVLGRDLEVTGPVHLTLWATTSAPSTDWTAKLVDVAPDGFARNVTDGILRTGYRPAGRSHPETPDGRPREYRIDAGATSNVFKAGHRIRLEISSSNFPRFDRNPNTGLAPATDARLARAVQHVFHDRDHPSRVTLPVIPRA